MGDHTPILPGLPPVESLDIHARFDGGAISSDGGALLLREIEDKLEICAMLAGCKSDPRDPARISHAHEEMIRARTLAIACGYKDANNMDELRHDLVGREEKFSSLPGRLEILFFRKNKASC